MKGSLLGVAAAAALEPATLLLFGAGSVPYVGPYYGCGSPCAYYSDDCYDETGRGQGLILDFGYDRDFHPGFHHYQDKDHDFDRGHDHGHGR